MSINRISAYSMVPVAAPAALIPVGFAVCQLPQVAQNPLAIQLAAQQQAYEQAILAAREDALRLVLSRLQPSLN
jgi:hypothetical protein